jgi:quinol monooxygenase YgiN
MPRQTLHVVARAIARAGAEFLVREQFEALVEPTRAERGCLSYELLVREDDPAEFVFVQEYEDDDAFEAHLASTHVTSMLEVVLPLLAEPPDIRRYRRASATDSD